MNDAGAAVLVNVLGNPPLSVAADAGQDEAALVARAKVMDEAAWDELLHQYYPRLRTFIAGRIGDPAAAEDLAAQVFVEAVARIGRYEWRGLPFAAWLFRIARNLSTDHLRRRTRSEGWTPEPDESVDPAHLVERQAESALVAQAMRALNDEQRQVLTLRFMDNLSTEDTARVMRKSTGAVKAIQHRALGAMRRALVAIDPAIWRTSHVAAKK